MEKGVRIHTVVTVIPTQLAESHSLDTGGMPVCGSGMWSSPWDWSPIHRRLESPSRLGLADQSNLPLEWQSFLEGIYARYYTTNVTKPFFFFLWSHSWWRQEQPRAAQVDWSFTDLSGKTQESGGSSKGFVEGTRKLSHRAENTCSLGSWLCGEIISNHSLFPYESLQ